MFEPFDIARWERSSVEQLKDELERDAARVEQLSARADESDDGNSSTESSLKPNLTSQTPTAMSPELSRSTVEPSYTHENPGVRGSRHGVAVGSSVELALLRRKYDLRPYGFSMVLDFGWSREEEELE